MTDEQISRLLAEHLGMIEGPYDVPASGRNVEPGSMMREIKIPNFVTDPAMSWFLLMKCIEVVKDDVWRLEDALISKNPARAIAELFLELIGEAK